MPFTLAHPAAVLLLRRTRLDFPALVIGSMAPDFPYFVDFSARNQFGHTVVGIFLFCVPVGLSAWFLYRSALVHALLALLPPARQAQVEARRRDPALTPSLLLWVALSLAIGAATHIVWDAFTHEPGAAVTRLVFLQERLPGVSIPVYKLLQFGGGLLGLVVLAIAGAREVLSGNAAAGQAVEGEPPIPSRLWLWLWASLLVTSAVGGLALAFLKGGANREHLSFHVVTGSVAAFAMGLAVAGALLWERKRRRPTG